LEQDFLNLPVEVACACCYWVQHATVSKDPVEDNGVIHQFLKMHFLHWMEALSWLGRLSSLVEYISTLKSCVVVSTHEIPRGSFRATKSADHSQPSKGIMLLSFLDDASCFVLHNQYSVDLAPLQLYLSALIFAPELSIVKRVFEHVRRHNSERWFDRLPEVPLEWSLEKQRLEARNEQFDCVVFAPDGSMLATASEDGMVRLWDAKKNEQVRELGGHEFRVTCVAFSPNGLMLASASWDKTVRLWDAKTGEQIRKLEGHESSVRSVAFSPDGRLIASGSGDDTVKIWNAKTSEEITSFPSNSDDEVLSFVASGRYLRAREGGINLAPYVSSSSLKERQQRMMDVVFDDQWIVYRDEDLLWLPHEYRESCSALYGELLVVGQRSGAMSFFGFRARPTEAC
jgi:WD40 repeat protein